MFKPSTTDSDITLSTPEQPITLTTGIGICKITCIRTMEQEKSKVVRGSIGLLRRTQF